MKSYWWRPEGGPPNFGDELTSLILTKMGASFERSSFDDAELIICGSLLDFVPPGWAGTVCGSGKLHERSTLDLRDARVFAVRGKLTAAAVRAAGPVVLGDPGLLVPLWFPRPQIRYELGVLAHWKDKDLHHKFSHAGHMIAPRQSPEKVIAEIGACRRLISSTLHGLVIADAYGIPRQAEPFDQNVAQEGGDFKFRDYMSIYGTTEVHFHQMWKAPSEVVSAVQKRLRKTLEIALGLDLPIPEHRRDPLVSLLVPYRDNGQGRDKLRRWTREYWRANLPFAEVIQGHDEGMPFSKASAVNQAATLARGRVFVEVDSDVILPSLSILTGATQIAEDLEAGKQRWFMPYNRSYRLSEQITVDLVQTSAADFRIAHPPTAWLDGPKALERSYHGHRFGAFAQMMPKVAFDEVGGFDERFRGWCCEDISMLRSLDTLYGRHGVVEGPALHLWHQHIGRDLKRRWVGQDDGENQNTPLHKRYAAASGDPVAMRALVEEHAEVGATTYTVRET